jgi:hypothetical protein
MYTSKFNHFGDITNCVQLTDLLMTISGTPIPLSVMHCMADPLVSAGQCVSLIRIKKLATRREIITVRGQSYVSRLPKY